MDIINPKTRIADLISDSTHITHYFVVRIKLLSITKAKN